MAKTRSDNRTFPCSQKSHLGATLQVYSVHNLRRRSIQLARAHKKSRATPARLMIISFLTRKNPPSLYVPTRTPQPKCCECNCLRHAEARFAKGASWRSDGVAHLGLTQSISPLPASRRPFVKGRVCIPPIFQTSSTKTNEQQCSFNCLARIQAERQTPHELQGGSNMKCPPYLLVEKSVNHDEILFSRFQATSSTKRALT